MSVFINGGYTLHYYDERTGESVSIPLEDVDVLIPTISHGSKVVVTYDETGPVTEEMIKSAQAYAKNRPEMLGPLEATFDLVCLDRRALSRAFYRTALEKVDVRPDPGPPRHDWHDRRKQHRNRKRRAWR